jgi:hypothetical protein
MIRVRTETEAIEWVNDWSMHAFQGKAANEGAYRSRSRCGNMGECTKWLNKLQTTTPG